jgi:hypothetical protein
MPNLMHNESLMCYDIEFICELQPVTIQPKPSQENQPVETSFLDKVEINKSDLSDEELKRGKDLILDYSDIRFPDKQ